VGQSCLFHLQKRALQVVFVCSGGKKKKKYEKKKIVPRLVPAISSGSRIERSTAGGKTKTNEEGSVVAL
jgi:hypothetical protein